MISKAVWANSSASTNCPRCMQPSIRSKAAQIEDESRIFVVAHIVYLSLAFSIASLWRHKNLKQVVLQVNAWSKSPKGRSFRSFSFLIANSAYWSRCGFVGCIPIAFFKFVKPTLSKCPWHSSLCCGQSAVWQIGPQYNIYLQALHCLMPGWLHPDLEQDAMVKF